MKVLVTGGTGYLGSHLVKSLLCNGHQVIILKRSFSNTRRIADLLSQLITYDVDRCDIRLSFQEHGPLDAVIHTATCYGRKKESHAEIFEANTAFPLRLLETAISFNTGTFFNTDTSLPPDLNAYALSKKQFTEWGKMFAKQKKVRFVNIVLEHFYGPGDDETKFVSWVIKSCRKNVPELRLTAGEQKRDFIYINDVIEAYLLLLYKMANAKADYHQFELGSGTPIKIKQFVEMIHRLIGSNTRLDFGAISYRPNEIMESKADISALEKLGWRPSTSLEQGLSETLKADIK